MDQGNNTEYKFSPAHYETLVLVILGLSIAGSVIWVFKSGTIITGVSGIIQIVAMILILSGHKLMKVGLKVCAGIFLLAGTLRIASQFVLFAMDRGTFDLLGKGLLSLFLGLLIWYIASRKIIAVRDDVIEDMKNKSPFDQTILFGKWYSEELKKIPKYKVNLTELGEHHLSLGQIILHIEAPDFLRHIAFLKIPVEHEIEGPGHYQILGGDCGINTKRIQIIARNQNSGKEFNFIIPIVRYTEGELKLSLFGKVLAFRKG